MVYRKVRFFSTYFVSCNGPCAPKEKWHRKEHIINIIIQISETDDVWEYMNETVLSTLYAFPNQTAATNVTLVLGGLRIRQVRQKNVKGEPPLMAAEAVLCVCFPLVPSFFHPFCPLLLFFFLLFPFIFEFLPSFAFIFFVFYLCFFPLLPSFSSFSSFVSFLYFLLVPFLPCFLSTFTPFIFFLNFLSFFPLLPSFSSSIYFRYFIPFFSFFLYFCLYFLFFVPFFPFPSCPFCLPLLRFYPFF